MGYYKIKNTTNKFNKRSSNKDLTLKIEYNVGFQKKYKKLPANGEIIMECKSLPASVHTLRVKKFIEIIEISENEFVRLQKPSSKPKPVEKPKNITTKKPKSTITKSTSSSTSKSSSTKTSKKTSSSKDESKD